MDSFDNASRDMFNTVVEYGFCIGCGVCAAFDTRIRITLDAHGRYVASLRPEESAAELAASRVCPFGDGTLNESDLAKEVFERCGPFDPQVGYHLATYAGWVLEPDCRERGSSGGLASWLLTELLKRGLVDRVVHVAPETAEACGKPLFRFAISSTSEEVRARSKSRYYPVEMSEVLREMLQRPGRYAVVGIPCFVKAVRLACRESSVLKERTAFIVGLVCGHLKSSAFAEMLAWQCGVVSDELKAIDFRTKLPDRPAGKYGVTVAAERKGRMLSVTKPTSELFGSNWGHGFFKYKACDFCDDVMGETADISIGDAWLPEYESDAAGTNVVVVRSQILNSLLTDAAASGRLHLDSIPVGKVVESQAGGFRHRRDGLAYRLFLEDQAGRWHPTKRVKPSADHLTPRLRKIYGLRQQLAEASHAAFAAAKGKQDFGVFLRTMKPLVARYERQYRQPFLFRILGRIKRIANFRLKTKS